MNWLVVAGLAKGGHRDRDDFYMRIKREEDSGNPTRWLPSADDQLLLRRETAARLITEWELGIQEQILAALREVQTGGSVRIYAGHPGPQRDSLAQLTIVVAPVRDPGYEADEMQVDIVPTARYAGSGLSWRLITRALTSLHPPEQGWDRYKDSYANIAEPGAWAARVAELETLVAENELAQSEPGLYSHFTHRTHLAGCTIEGRAVRALCGVFFVPTQDHKALATCSLCQQRHDELPT